MKPKAGKVRAIQRVFRTRIRLPGMLIRVVCAVILGLVGMVVFAAVQWGLASRAYPGGVVAFGHRQVDGPWTGQVENQAWRYASFRSWYGDWFGAVSVDAYSSPMMYSFVSTHAPGGFLRWDANFQLPRDEWISAVDLRSNSWIAGCESFAVGWPMRCFRATYAWKNKAEYERMPRAIVVEGSEIDGPEHRTWIESLLGGIGAPYLLKEIIPTHVLWTNAIVNWAVWSSALFAVSYLPRGARFARGLYRVKRGRCGQCGYDVRASKGLCPECGGAIGGRSGEGAADRSGG